MANVKLKVLNVENYSTPIGRSTVDYATLKCVTENEEEILVALTHNAVKAKTGLDDASAIDLLKGCTIIAQDSVNSDTGVLEEADEKVQKVLDGTWGVITLNSRNCSIIKTDLFNAEIRDLQAKVKAKVTIEREKEAKLTQQKRAEERYNAKLAAKLAASQPPPTEEQTEPLVETTAEVDEDPQF